VVVEKDHAPVIGAYSFIHAVAKKEAPVKDRHGRFLGRTDSATDVNTD
jgi:hypothetical protein